MNISFDKHTIHIVLKFFIAIAALHLLSSIATIFLPKVSIEKYVSERAEIPYQNLKISKLFNVSNITAPQEAQKVEERIYELNNLELKALFKDSQGGGWIVLIDKGNANKSEILKNGDAYKGYKLVEIQTSSAIFEQGGKKYSVVINKPDYKNIDFQPEVQTAPQNTQEQQAEVVRAIPQREIDKYKQDYKAIWKSISIKETVENGEITGFKIRKIEENSIFAQLGFKVGDVIKAVNNKVLKSYADAFKIYNNIDQYKSLKFTILRDNQERELEYEVY